MVDLPLHFIRSWEHYIPITGYYNGEIDAIDNLYPPDTDTGMYKIKLNSNDVYLDENNGGLLLSASGCAWNIDQYSHSQYIISIDNHNKLLLVKDEKENFICIKIN